MKKLLLLTIFLSSNLAFTQELNQDFLDSLPDDIRDDLENTAKDQSKNENPVYRSLQNQTELKKRELEDLKAKLKLDLEYLEKRLAEDGENKTVQYELKVFGSEFFSTYQSTYMPISEPNLSPSYVLDFGDALEIQLVGRENKSNIFEIKRDGSINIENIKPIKLIGLSLGEAISIIKSKIAATYVGTEAYITLSNVRDINVLVSGNAFNPGIFTVSGNSNMLHVLGIAGGINEYGSYREINLIRDQKVIETLDMYDVLITGAYKTSVSLRSGDIIFVKPINKLVSIDGAVKIPGKYEMLDNQTLSDLVEYSNGISKEADLNNIFLDRILDGRIKSLPIRNISQFEDIVANDGDSIYIRKHLFKSVNIRGAISRPGTYLMGDGESLNDLIEKSGGFTINSYPFGTIYETQDAFLINKMANEKLYAQFLENIINATQKTGTNINTAVLEITESLKDNIPNGRVVVDIVDETLSKQILLKDGDSITVPEKSNNIYVYGEVNYEGALRFEDNQDIEYFINKSGGLKENASMSSIYVLHPNGDTKRFEIGRKNLFQNSPSNEELMLYPGSVIFVPRQIDNTVGTRMAAQAYVSILGNIGIALASLSSIKNN
ncbi:SLBB domain-containing protein [Gammaproteobacteria bacterium]|nr:SLBB domain-containing protein [Gammaproteobacteria bacterium]MDA7709895.1 SLBB domain-containing protein [Gammaproteobacteria bacterium]